MHAADAARREDLDAREVRRHGRAGDRRRADERAVAITGGALFVLFGVHALVTGVEA